MINEIYKDIKGYEGLYQISNLGNVKSINEAGRETNSSIGTIQKCCVGISHTCNGYKWKFVLDEENKE